LQAAEFHDRLHVASQELELAQQRLQRLQLQLQLLAVDLDVVLILKQGQIEVEESPVVTDMSDAVLVNQSSIQSQNQRILHQGGVMVSLLRDTMKLQSGIQRFRWDAEELDMREEDVTSRIRHFQLLRVTKDLQLRISGAETKSNLDNVANLEKQLGNLHEVLQGRQFLAFCLLMLIVRLQLKSLWSRKNSKNWTRHPGVSFAKTTSWKRISSPLKVPWQSETDWLIFKAQRLSMFEIKCQSCNPSGYPHTAAFLILPRLKYVSRAHFLFARHILLFGCRCLCIRSSSFTDPRDRADERGACAPASKNVPVFRAAARQLHVGLTMHSK
jgi:hypothetical protein